MAVYPGTQLVRPAVGIAAYRHNEVAYASPQDLLLKLYDVAIASCRQRDARRSRAALVELIDSLNFEYAQVATGLLRLYNYCLDLIRDEQFDDAQAILADLRETWAKALANATGAAAS